MRGLDILQPVGERAAAIKAAGYGWVGRYLKNLTLTEAKALSAAGLQIVSIWEPGAGNKFNAQLGRSGAAAAVNAARAIGQPRGTAIVSAIDFDCGPADLQSIIDYFVAFQDGLIAGGYRSGAYGNGYILGNLKSRRLIDAAYLAGAMGWNGSEGYAGWTIIQRPTITDETLGLEIDPCETAGDQFGSWSLAAGPASGVAGPIPSVRDLQNALNDAGFHIAVDGKFGPATAAALGRYYREHA